MIDILTDNKNRTASELRKIFDKKGGQLGSPGSVSWMFETRGVIELPADSITEDDLLELALEAGADDVKVEEGHLQVLTSPAQFTEVREAIAAANLEPSYAEVTRIPTSTVKIEDEKTATKVLKFIAEVEDNDDVQNVHTNMDISPEMLEKLSD